MCQLQHLKEISTTPGFANNSLQKLNRLKRIFKRRLRFMLNVFLEIANQKSLSPNGKVAGFITDEFQPGDTVRIRSREEIQCTLNHWNQLKGCSFMEEMWKYCGTKQRIFKKINRFLDERDYLIKKPSGIFILDGIICEGTKDFGPCDRSCFLFWRKEWLKKIEQ